MTLTASNPVAIGNSTFTEVWSINDQDEVAGGTATNAAVWQNGQATVLPGILGDTGGLATAVNGQGLVVGYSNTGATVYHSIQWQNGVATQLPGLGSSNRIFDISGQGIMVGSAEDSSGLAVAVEISNGTVTQLGELPGGDIAVTGLATSRAFSINDQGQVVGISLTSAGVQHAVLWQNGTVTDLGSINGGTSFAYQINDHGVAVGYAVDGNNIDQAVVWQNGAMTVLPDHQSNGHSIAYGINDAGIIVGRSDIYTVSTGWQEDAVVWQNGVLIDLNTLLPSNSGWVLNYARSINDNGEITGMGTYDGVSTAFVMSIGDSSGPMMSAATAEQAFQTTPHTSALSVLDTAANIQADLSGLETIASAAKLLQVQMSDAGTPVLTLTAAQVTADADVLADLSGSYALQITGETVNQAYDALNNSHVTAVSIADSSFDVEISLDQLQGWVAAGRVTGISLTDGASDPSLYLTAQQVTNDAQALKAITGNYQLNITGATVAQALTFSSDYNVQSVDITDTIDAAVTSAVQLKAMNGTYSLYLSGSAADLTAHYSDLSGLFGWTSFGEVTVTDTNFPTVSITAEQYNSNFQFAFDLHGNFLLSIDMSQTANATINQANVPMMVVFPDAAADYSLSTWGGVGLEVTDTGTGRSSSDLIFGATAVKFADGTDFIVQAPSSTGATSGNIAELYAAVLGRIPDATGLAYYEHLLLTGQAPSMLQLAENFLASPEYANNPAHNYAQSAAGDAQFITDTYQNLLHRAPESGAVPYYQAMLAQYTAGLTPGSAAYSAASTQAHAQLLVDFSASGEFLNDVQITGQHPQDAQHWLFVI